MSLRFADHKLFFSVLILVSSRLLLSLPFSSGYQEELFLPFLNDFNRALFSGDLVDPWKLAVEQGRIDAFPYHPLMFYVHALFSMPGLLLPDSHLWKQFWFLFPAALADLLLFATLLKMFPARPRAVLLLYGASPIILFAVYLHGQLDLWPTALLFLSIRFLLENRYRNAGIALGAALAFKLHVAAAIPLIAFYLYRQRKSRNAVHFGFWAFLVYAFASLPWYASEPFRTMVLFNEKQSLLFDTVYRIGDYQLQVPILAVLFIYFRFFAYKKVNRDLFLTWTTILFAVFVMLVPPGPAWYVWLTPFLTYFYIRFLKRDRHILYMTGLLGFSYLAFFLFAWKGDYATLLIMGKDPGLPLLSGKPANILFTLLQASLATNLFAVYLVGLRSNNIYRRPGAVLLGIGGDSGAGKTTLLKSLRKLLAPSVTLLEGDGDHRWERGHQNWTSFTHLNPRANYLERQAENLILLKNGQRIFRPEYDHSTGTFTEPKPVEPSDFIILSGLHPFYLPKMRKVIDLKIFLDTDERLRRHWKILRDTTKRGYSREKIQKQIEARLQDAGKYIEPQKGFADLVIQYFAMNDFEPGDREANIQVGLRLQIRSEYHIEDLIISMEEEGFLSEWDYMDDLQSQYFIFTREPDLEAILSHAQSMIPNIDEVLSPEREWSPGYDGLTQLFTLIIISQIMQGGMDHG